jgi:hypothetical protein
MSLQDELARLLQPMVADAVRAVLAEQLRLALPASGDPVEYLSFARAAELVDVKPATIRQWIRRGWLKRYGPKGAERVRVDELRDLMAKQPTVEEDAVQERIRRLVARSGDRRRRPR